MLLPASLIRCTGNRLITRTCSILSNSSADQVSMDMHVSGCCPWMCFSNDRPFNNCERPSTHQSRCHTSNSETCKSTSNSKTCKCQQMPATVRPANASNSMHAIMPATVRPAKQPVTHKYHVRLLHQARLTPPLMLVDAISALGAWGWTQYCCALLQLLVIAAADHAFAHFPFLLGAEMPWPFSH